MSKKEQEIAIEYVGNIRRYHWNRDYNKPSYETITRAITVIRQIPEILQDVMALISPCSDQTIHIEWSLLNKKLMIEIPKNIKESISYLLAKEVDGKRKYYGGEFNNKILLCDQVKDLLMDGE